MQVGRLQKKKKKKADKEDSLEAVPCIERERERERERETGGKGSGTATENPLDWLMKAVCYKSPKKEFCPQ